ncbi:iron complex transport system ATP-binding protein [Roseivivax halotolerans]|uniref:Iron complex transport system ATP-binding protein n=1 Tax=Roseivivax halotolerans TaxID=93684 RepID=A0A1I6A6S2_9RHOB|nr:ABC transporter ATP-binding protein [Roseivivax halotolerans]SFQ64323.1 iron complex transport system ATP-binding protein [Roseivivax halotolerans]
MEESADPAVTRDGSVRGPGSAIRCAGICAGYSTERILHDVDFCALDGGITALVGPNGCGKSTLLKVLARILKPGSGRIELFGAPLADVPTRQIAQKMALLPQGPIAPEGLSVRELVAQGRFPHQSLLRQWTRKDADAVDEAMALTDVAELADRPVASLSGGQRQRCWIAMVLAQDTEVILLDEPTTFLDLRVQVDIMSLLYRIAREKGRTLVVVLHELNMAAAYADRIVMMRDGCIVQEGLPGETVSGDNLSHVFDLDAQVIADPETGRPVCIPRTRIQARAAE